MTPEEAEKIFYEYGEVLSNQWLTKPERFGPNLRCVSRAGLRKAILMWVAKKKFDGINILYRHELLPGQRIAVLELAQQIWPLTSIFGALQDGLPIPEPSEETKDAAQRHDDFLSFLEDLDRADPAFWQKVQAKLEA